MLQISSTTDTPGLLSNYQPQPYPPLPPYFWHKCTDINSDIVLLPDGTKITE